MNKNRHRWLVAIVIGLAATVAALLSSRTALFNRWEKQAEDLIYRNFASGQAFDGVVIIAVDQNSLDYFQENLQLLWPWPRDVYALAT
ncbi:MAG TPA: CHASE2 domain-containing protein, partial [Candidatus Marinimicrobia bacterium]|nr:CHASE2 domain-containing protein [Candidatus Neomarinimicrobiota bacterium]